ncbi:MAG: hypothetical protein JZU65_23890 [Chlorobium sp.]|nr:hypothetical protein [Chlorobium sp.]
MIQIIQGTPGSGKSAVATVDMLEFLQAGGVVACNYDLIPGWHHKLAQTLPRVRWGWLDPSKVAASYYSRAFKIGTHDTVFDLSKRLRDIPSVKKDKRGRITEGSGRLYIDEGQLLFNTRDYQKNMGFIEFFTQHRKFGWDVYIIAHTADMIDKQIRGLIEYEARLRNMQKIKIGGLVPLWPYPLFFSIVRYAGIAAGAGNIAWRRVYKLRPEYAELYDSMEVFAFNASSREVSHQGPADIIASPKPKRVCGPCSCWPSTMLPAQNAPAG